MKLNDNYNDDDDVDPLSHPHQHASPSSSRNNFRKTWNFDLDGVVCAAAHFATSEVAHKQAN